MYKFTNGLVIYDDKAKDICLKLGYKLVKEIKSEDKPKCESKQERPRKVKTSNK